PSMYSLLPIFPPSLAVHSPVLLDLDLSLQLIDSELTRLRVAQKLPFAHEIDNSALTTQERKDVRNGSALQRAKTVLEIHKRVGGQDKSATAFEFEESEPDLTYLLSRDYLENAPTQSNSL